MIKINILGVKIDQINMAEVVEKVDQWLRGNGKHYIVTPNIEFVILAQTDSEFRRIINNADLAIPDSARFGWAKAELSEENIFVKILKWPLFLFPQLFQFDVVTGTDLMEELIKKASDQGFTIGFLGGRDLVAEKLKERLLKKYPKLLVIFADPGGLVNSRGKIISGSVNLKLPAIDLLFVAFGQGKQEKWISKNLALQPVKVMMGVGGAFDYLSGEVPRAPKIMRQFGFEWLYRIILQPWRAKRFIALFQFIFKILLNSN